MATASIEHVNLSVSDSRRSSALFERLFGWQVRWEGPARDGGHSIHVGDAQRYVALYTPRDTPAAGFGHAKGRPLNHVGIEVDNLAEVAAAVVAAGLKPFGHEAYDPGERFYFFDWDGIEFEIVSYA